jgi:hypothetical protein
MRRRVPVFGRMVRVREPDEEPLGGGNVSAAVCRVGESVRRPATAATPAVSALLKHLERSGFGHAPRFLGTDEQGRQMLSWIPGRVQHDLGPLDIDGLERVGSIIREFHEASASFVPPRGAQWQVPITPDRGELIVHHDLAPWNLVVDGDVMTFIDWDGSGPGSRLWDLSYAAHGFAIIDADADPTPAGRRLAALVDGYQLGRDERRRLVPMLAERTRSMYVLLVHGHRTGTQPWARLYEQGHADHWVR